MMKLFAPLFLFLLVPGCAPDSPTTTAADMPSLLPDGGPACLTGATTGSPAVCAPGGKTARVCLGGGTFDAEAACCAGPIAAFSGTKGAYDADLAELADPRACAGQISDGAPVHVGVAAHGVCGAYRYVETQGLGIGSVVYRFYDVTGRIVGAITWDDVAGKCAQSWGHVPDCTPQQCDVVCSGKYTC